MTAARVALAAALLGAAGAQQTIQASSFLVVRTALPTTLVANTSVAMSIEEHNLGPDDNPLGDSILQTIDLPTVASGSNLACTAWAATGDVSFSLTRSRAGTVVALPCYNVEPQVGLASISYPPATFVRTIARITQDGVVDTSAGCNDCYIGSGAYPFSALVDETVSPQRIYTTGSLGISSAAGGVRLITNPTSRTSTGILTGGTLRQLGFLGNWLLTSYSGNTPSQGVVRQSQGGSQLLLPVNSTNVAACNLMTNCNQAGFGDPHSSNVGSFGFDTINTMWTADCNWGINIFRRNASSLTTYTWIGSWRVPGSGAGIRFAAARNNTAGQLIVVGTQCTAPYSLWHFNTVTRVYTKLADPPAGTFYKGVSLAPYSAAISQPAATPVASPSQPATPSVTPLATANAFQTTSLLTVRTGDAASASYAAAGVALPVYVDEIEPSTGRVIQSLPLPTTTTVNGAACSLTAGWPGGVAVYGEQEGQPQLSADGKAVVFPCWTIEPGAADRLIVGGLGKTVAYVSANGRVDTRLTFTGGYGVSADALRPLTLRTATTLTGSYGASPVLIAGTSSVNPGFYGAHPSFGGVAARLTSSPEAGSLALQNTDPRYINIYNGVAYITVGTAGNTNNASYGVHYVTCSGVPCVPAASFDENVQSVRMNGTQATPVSGNGTNPFDIVFESPTVMWVADDLRRFNWSVVRYTATAPASGITQPWQATQWTVTATVSLDPSRQLQSLTGRTEGGAFVLYAGYAHKIVSYNTVTGVKADVALAPQGFQWHGVTLPPYDAALAAPAAPTAAPTPAASPAPITASSSIFQASSLMVVRVGDGWTYSSGRFMPISVIEVNTDTGDVMQEIAMPAAAVGSSAACTTLQPSAGTSETFMMLSGNGQMLTLACADRPVNGSLSTSGYGRTIAIITADGTIDTTQRVPDAYYYTATTAAPTYFRSVYTIDGTEFWLAGRSVSGNTALYYADSGIRYKRYGDYGTTQVTFPLGAMEARYCGIGAGSPYGASQLLCATRDGWTLGNGFGMQLLTPGLPRNQQATATNIAGLQTSASLSQWLWAWESPTRVWIAGSVPAGSVFQYDRADTSSAWAQTASFVMDSTQNSYAMNGRWENGVFVLYTTGQSRVYAYNTATLTTRVILTAPANYHFRSAAFAPQGAIAATPSSSRTNTASATVTPSPSSTASNTPSASTTGTPTSTSGTSPSTTASMSPSPSVTATATTTPIVAAFRAGNMLFLRAANNTALNYVAGRYVPGFIDEFDPVSQVVVQSIALPTEQTTNADGTINYRCTMVYAAGGEGYLHTTTDGRAVTFACYDGVLGAVVNHTGGVRRVLAAVFADGRIDTRTSCADCWIGTGTITTNLRSAHSSDVYSGFTLTGQSSAAITTGGLRYIPYGGSSSRVIATTGQRYAKIENSFTGLGPVLVATVAGNSAGNAVMYAPIPNPSNLSSWSSMTVSSWTMLPGQEAILGWTTVAVTWQYHVSANGALVYVTDTSNGQQVQGTYPFKVNGYWLQYSQALSRYTFGGYWQIDNATAVQNIAGRNESDGYTIYAVTQVPMRVFAYNHGTTAKRLLHTPAAGNYINGISFVPVDNFLQPSASATPSNTPSPSQTPSQSPTPTASVSNTATNTGTPSSTATLTASPSNTASRTAPPTPSSTATLSFGAPPSVTATPSPKVQVIPPSSVVVLRSGDGSSTNWGRAGITAPAFLDVYDPAAIGAGYGATPVMSIALATAAAGSSGACTLPQGSFWDRTATGASLSFDEKWISFPCYNVAVGTNLTQVTNSTTVGAPISVVRMGPDGVADTTTRPGMSYIGSNAAPFSMVRGAYTVSGGGFYLTGSSATFTGVRFAAYGSTGSSLYMGTPSDSRTLRVTAAFNNLGAGAPTGTDPVMVVSSASTGNRGLSWYPVQTTTNATGLGTAFFLLPGFAAQAQVNPDPWGWHVSPSSGKVYVADSRASGSIAVYSYSPTIIGGWGQESVIATGESAPIFSLCGREEGGVTVLYAVASVLSNFSGALWRIDTSTGTATKLLTSASFTQLRAVMLPPVDATYLQPSPSATPSALPTRTGTRTGTPASTPASTGTSSITASPSTTGTPTPTLSTGAQPSVSAAATVPPSASATRTPAASATQTPWTARFMANSLVVLRGGNATVTTGTANRMLPLVIDVITVDPSTAVTRVIDSIAVPSEYDPATGNNGCTLAFTTTGYQQEGFLQPSWDGKVVTWACHTLQPGLTQPNSVVTPRTIAILRADGTVDTRTTYSDAYTGGTGFSFARAVASQDGSAFWISGFAPGGASNGIRYAAYTGGATTTRAVFDSATNNVNYRFLSIGPDPVTAAPQLYVGLRDFAPQRGLNLVGTGLPTAAAADVGLTLAPGWAAWQYTSNVPLILGFVWESPTSVWTADMISFQYSPTPATFSLVQWYYAGGSWVRNATIFISGTTQTQALTGRTEPDGRFYLYTCNNTHILRVDAGARTVTPIHWAPAGTAFYGMTVPPVRSDIIPATATSTLSATASVSATASLTMSSTPPPTPSATLSPGASQSSSPSNTATNTGTPTPTNTPTSTVTPSGTPTRTRTATTTPTTTATASRTGTPSVTRTPPVTTTPTPTGTPPVTTTPTASLTGSQTGTASPSRTASNTGTPSSSQTGTGTPSSSQTGTQTGTPSSSQTGTQTGTPSSSGTSTNTGTPSASISATGTGTPSFSATATGSVAPSFSATKSRQPSASKTKTRSATATRTKTKTRTATATKTKTKTKTKTPSKKKLMMA